MTSFVSNCCFRKLVVSSRILITSISTRISPFDNPWRQRRFVNDHHVVVTRRNLVTTTNIPKEGNKKEEEPEITINIQDNSEKPKVKDEVINIDDYNIEIKVEMPDLGETKGKILRWYKKEGDIIRHDETICDIETEMFTFGMDVEDENEGIMKEILVKEGGGFVKPGTPICSIMHKPL